MVRACLPYSRSVEPMRSLRYSIRPPRNSMSMVPPSMVVSRETDFGVEGSMQRGLGYLAHLADGGNAAFGERSRVHVADAVELFHGQRRQEIFFFAGRDHAKPTRALQP